MSVPSPLGRLPTEIVVEICFFAACSSLKTSLNLALVSSEIRRRTARYLYATVILRTARQVASFVSFLRSQKVLTDTKLALEPARYVRNLCITYHVQPAGWLPSLVARQDPFADIFEHCRNVQRSALQSTFLHSRLAPDHPVHRLRCKELTIFGPIWPSDWERHAEIIPGLRGYCDDEGYKATNADRRPQLSIFISITHLILLDPFSSPRTSATFLSRLQKLTHVAFLTHEPIRNSNPFNELEALLSAMNIIMVVVIFNFRTWIGESKDLDKWASLAIEQSDKLYVVEKPPGDSLDQWTEILKGGEDIWELARRRHDEWRTREGSINPKGPATEP